ncbi:MAG: hypothetical protein, partial [Olavius algarvensis Gamma 1 endosymbiont]
DVSALRHPAAAGAYQQKHSFCLINRGFSIPNHDLSV